MDGSSTAIFETTQSGDVIASPHVHSTHAKVPPQQQQKYSSPKGNQQQRSGVVPLVDEIKNLLRQADHDMDLSWAQVAQRPIIPPTAASSKVSEEGESKKVTPINTVPHTPNSSESSPQGHNTYPQRRLTASTNPIMSREIPDNQSMGITAGKVEGNPAPIHGGTNRSEGLRTPSVETKPLPMSSRPSVMTITDSEWGDHSASGQLQQSMFVHYCVNAWTHEETARVLQQVLYAVNMHQCTVDGAEMSGDDFTFPHLYSGGRESSHGNNNENSASNAASMSVSQRASITGNELSDTLYSPKPGDNIPLGDKASTAPPVVMTDKLQKSQTEEGFKCINGYIILNEIGRGTQGKVKLAFKEDDPEQLRAIKIIRKPKKSTGIQKSYSADVHHEIAILKKLRHKHVVALYEVIDDPDSNKLYLVMEYIERGPLVVLSENQSKIAPLDVDVARGYMRQLCSGLAYLHHRKIAHRDIKADNILLSNNGKVLLGDFGMSTIITSHKSLHDIGGTPAYRAPETFEDRAFDPLAADVWALGVSFYLILFGELPFSGGSLQELRQKVRYHDPFSADAVKGFPERNAVRLLRRMLARDVAQRTTARHCLKSSFLIRGVSQVNSGHHVPRVKVSQRNGGEEEHEANEEDVAGAFSFIDPQAGSPFKLVQKQHQQHQQLPHPPSATRQQQGQNGGEKSERVRINGHNENDPLTPHEEKTNPMFSVAHIGSDDEMDSSSRQDTRASVSENDIAMAVAPFRARRVTVSQATMAMLPRKSIASLVLLHGQNASNDDDDDDDDDNDEGQDDK